MSALRKRTSQRRCAGRHEKADVLRALTEALISAIVERADTAQIAEQNAARLTGVISAEVRRAVVDDRLN